MRLLVCAPYRRLYLLLLVLLLAGCTSGGDQGQATAPSPSAPGSRVERQAIDNLLALYQEAAVAEDSDRLQALLAPATALGQAQSTTDARQDPPGALTNLTAWQDTLRSTFQQATVTALTIPPATVEVAPDQSSVTFLEVESTLDPRTVTQHTRVYRTTWQLRRATTGNTATFGIAAVQRAGPLAQITTPGQVQAGALTRVSVTAPTAGWALARVETDPTASLSGALLRATPQGFHGTFRAAVQAPPAPLQVRLYSTGGDELSIAHAYRLRQSGERVVQPVAGTTTTRLLAVAVAPDGTVWAGGDQGGRLFQVAPGATAAQLVGRLLADATGRIEDLTLDGPGRLQAVVFAPQQSGVIVRTPAGFCQTVNAFDPAYPLRTANGQPSPGTRAVAAGAEAIWVHGSDAGIARVTDGIKAGPCPTAGGTVQYDSVLRREDGRLLANTVPAVLVGRDGALWVGSALGLSRLQDGQVTRVPFAPELSFRGNPATLEAFFQAVAQAIFTAQPVNTVALGGVSFIEAFGSPLVKEDLIFSLAEDGQERLWVGTLGGGLRRVERRNGVLQDTLHLTRADGLASNLLFALAVAPDGAIWAATDEGVSRLVEGPGGVTITTLSALDGLPVPARDVALDAAGTAWVATDRGLVRIGVGGGVLTGAVQESAGTPVAGADVLLQGTPLRAVTDAEGRFSVAHVPPGAYLLRVESTLATPGPLTLAVQEVVVTAGSQTMVLVRLGAPVPFDPQQGGRVIFPAVPGAALEVPPGATTLPPDTVPALGLTALPLMGLPQSLQPGFTPVAAAAFDPDGISFSRPARLTLPLFTPLRPGQLGILLHFNVATQTYEQVGLGRVSTDGTRMTTLSGGLRQLSTVVFAITGAQATKVFLVPVVGNNQRVQPGEVLPEPLVVRLEDQFGNPVVGEVVAVRITRGEGTVVAADATTNAQGEARVRVQAGASDTDLVVAVAAPALPEVRPAQFFAVIGAFDTPGDALDLAVAGDVVFIADVSNGGLQVIDVQDPTRPVRLHTLLSLGNSGFPTFPTSVTRHGNRLYVGTFVPEHLYVLDISHARAPDFAADRDGNGVPDVVLGSAALPTDLGARALAVVGGVVYGITASFTPGVVASFHAVDVTQDSQPRLLSTIHLPVLNPTGLAVAGDMIYVGARTAGVLIFDAHEPLAPRLVRSVGDPNPADTIAVSVVAGPVVAGQFAYLIETQQEQRTGQMTEHFVVLDVHTPLAPVRRGSVPLHGVTREAVLTTVGTRLAVAGAFAYVTRGALGVQAVDIRQPDTPRPVGAIAIPSFALSVAAVDEVLYVTDAIFGLQVIRGPRPDEPDTDGDGVIDFFDAFPTDPTEWQDTDDDRVGDNADPDSDNDGFTDAEEATATPPTDALDPRLYPVTPPPPGVTTLLVDAASPVPVRARNGTPEAPYRNFTEALQVLRNGQAPQVHTLFLRAGRYAPSTTHDAFPLDLSGLAHLTLRGEDRTTTVLDAEFRNSVVVATGSRDLVIEDLTITHGWHGLFVVGSRDIVIRRIEARDHNRHGIGMGAATTAVLQDNLVESSRAIAGIGASAGTEVVLIRNVSRANPLHGIAVISGARADMRDNVFEDNGLSGIAIDLNSSATLTNNLTQGNALDGLTLNRNARATLTDNVIQDNGRDGIAIVDASEATINGGTITRNSRDGLRVGGGTVQPGRSTAAVGLDDTALLELSQNGGAGLLVGNDGSGSEARIDSRQLVFSGNAGGATVGNVIDVAVGP